MKIPNDVIELVSNIVHLESKREECIKTIKDLLASIEALNIKIKSMGT